MEIKLTNKQYFFKNLTIYGPERISLEGNIYYWIVLYVCPKWIVFFKPQQIDVIKLNRKKMKKVTSCTREQEQLGGAWNNAFDFWD